MRRRLGSDDSLDRFWTMLRDKRALRLILAGLPAGATLEEARLLHRKARQLGRTPCSFLDAELGIRRV